MPAHRCPDFSVTEPQALIVIGLVVLPIVSIALPVGMTGAWNAYEPFLSAIALNVFPPALSVTV